MVDLTRGGGTEVKRHRKPKTERRFALLEAAGENDFP